MRTKVFTVAEMVAAERAADRAGLSYATMMETAGRRVAEAITARMDVHGRRVLVLVGPGNNGGDGLVAGRYLAEAGADVAFYLYQERDSEQDVNFRLIQELGLFVAVAAQDQRFRVLRTRLGVSELVIDALMGTGVTRPIEGQMAALMKQVGANLSAETGGEGTGVALHNVARLRVGGEKFRPFVCAVDCPSGLNCDTGALDPLAIAADLSVTFAGPKRGHLAFPGAAACGELVVADIQIPSDLPEVAGIPLSIVTADDAWALLPDRPLDGHKGTFGTALIAAGSADYWGAPVLAGHGAYRAGVGLVVLAVPQRVRAAVATQLPEATYPAVAATETLDGASATFLLEQVRRAQAILFGPGLGGADSFVRTLLQDGRQEGWPTLIVDADGLNILSRMDRWWEKLPPNSILTPHPGEMSRLMGVELAVLKRGDRVTLAMEMAQAWGQVVLLKGPYTVVAAADGRAAQLPFANPLLAVGGSGDVLAGMIAGLAAQGMQPFEAAVLGAYLHAGAAELAKEKWGESGMLAGELAACVPMVRKRLFSGS